MRQTLNDFSLDSLSSLLDDELTLDALALPAAASSAAGTSSPGDASVEAPARVAAEHVPSQPAVTSPIELAPAPVPTEAVGTQLFGTQLVGTQVVGTQLLGTQLVSIPSSRKSAVAQTQAPVPADVRKSSLEETQLYKSTPQPTIDLSVVRRSASEPTQAFDGNLAALGDLAAPCYLPSDASATIPAQVDPSKSSVPETTFWSKADRDSALLEAANPDPSVTAPVAPAPAASAPSAGATELVSPEAPPSVQGPPEQESSPTVTTPRTIAQQLAGFFGGQPRRTTEVKWEQAVESDRRFTTMLLSDLDAAMNEPMSTDSDPGVPFALPVPPAASPAFAPGPPFAAEATVPSQVAAQPAQAVSYETLEVAGVEQASSLPALAESDAATIEPASFAGALDPSPSANAPSHVAPGRAAFPEPSAEVRQLASCVLERSTPGVATVVAVVGCDETQAGAEATLALAAAVADATGVSTLVVDGDFARRDLSRVANAVEAPGFAESLAQSTKGRSLAQSAGRDNLQVLPAGAAPPEASEAPARVSAWIARAKQEHGLILVWLGSSGGEYERRLCGAADLSLLLAVVDKDRPSRIEAAAERLRSANARTLGVALVRG